jgi:FecR-like protein/sporulation related protein
MTKIHLNVAVLALALAGAAAFAQTEQKPAGAKPAEAKPAEAKPAEAQPAEARPADAKPAETKRAAKAPGAPQGPVVYAVQAPAWIERDGNRIPAIPGMPLKERDQLHTGPDSRLWVSTPDGSVVKMGENGSLAIESMQMRKDRVFRAALKVVEGAFRFTTEALAKFRGKRDINIGVATVTAGIRGTDLWGKSSRDKQIVCLIEGRIELTPPGEAPLAMDQPMSFYVRENNQSQPVAPVPPEQLKIWAAETETQPGRGVTRRGGKWKITVAAPSAAAALKTYEDIRAAGYPAELQPTKVADKRVYTVRLSNFITRHDAEAAAAELKSQGRIVEGYKVGM